jgi:predicted RNA binding protein YcfA (HicA-like mRNA interferase family)
MTRLPRDIGGAELAAALERLGYQVTRQTGSHLRLTRTGPETQHLTIPAHRPLRVGTLAAILAEVAEHLGITREDLLERLFGR